MNKQFLLLVALIIATATLVNAQGNYPWSIGFSTNAIDFTSTDPIFEGYFDTDDWNSLPVITKFTLSRKITNGLDVELSHAFNRARKRPLVTNINEKRAINDSDLNFKLGIGKLISKNSWFDPYLIAGGGLTWENDIAYGNYGGGAGFNIWANENWGFNVQSVYDVMPDPFPNYFMHSAGVIINFGGEIADMDNDGVADEKDKCPNTAGLKALNGCPDTDLDGVVDSEDKCPKSAGPVANMGCPDTDGDGMHDGIDKCIDKAGTAEFEGCPDTDGDGITDTDDRCPNEKGLKEDKGCPKKDSDNDGVLDENDKCPNVAGSKSMNGCPDSDGDGIADNADRCPQVRGAASNAGCPVVVAEPVIDKVQVEQELNFNAKSINFESGSDVIKTSSYGVLDNIVGIMGKYPKASFSIEGHTDSQGNDANNLSLSQRRAIAVVNYFMKKGVVGSRISAAGFGETQPIADNNTADGRATNRRVEIRLK